jgi:DnaK suppressor protein
LAAEEEQMTPASKASSTGSRTAAKGKTTKAAAKKATKAPVKKTPAKKAVPPKKAPVKKAPAKKATKAPVKKAPAKKAVPAQKAPAKKAVAAKKAPVAQVPAKKAPAPKIVAAKEAAPVKVPSKKAAPRPRSTVGPYASDTKFLEEQRLILLAEKDVYQEQANMLKAEADSLAHEREPGDVQFDEESGEGGTVTVDRERDLALSAQASLAVEEIEDALVRVTRKTYGACERCHQPIMKARLRALAYARLCVACKSGGLSRR